MRSLLSDQIYDFITAAVNAGFSKVLVKEHLEMSQSLTTFLPVRLEEGNFYAVAARCGDNCRLRLVLKDASGQEVKSDDHLNDKPTFVFRPNWTGEYALSLQLAVCSASVCPVEAVVLVQTDQRHNTSLTRLGMRRRGVR
jgi:hypothetical protein